MARYGKEHKEATRRRIVEAAGRRFKRDGIDGSGIATLMADAGLTNGAFYAHFDSKDDLVATTVADQLREQRESYWQRPGAGVEQLVREYLSVRHRDDPEHGCPSAALLDEIGRCPASTKQAYTDGVLAIADEIAARLAPDDPESARATTLSLFALLIGTLQLSRALADRQLADEVLERGIENALALPHDVALASAGSEREVGEVLDLVDVVGRGVEDDLVHLRPRRTSRRTPLPRLPNRRPRPPPWLRSLRPSRRSSGRCWPGPDRDHPTRSTGSSQATVDRRGRLASRPLEPRRNSARRAAPGARGRCSPHPTGPSAPSSRV